MQGSTSVQQMCLVTFNRSCCPSLVSFFSATSLNDISYAIIFEPVTEYFTVIHVEARPPGLCAGNRPPPGGIDADMRLIRCDTLELVSFAETEIPKYVILSHTWGNEEVTFQDLTTLPQSTLAAAKPGGFAKLQGFCRTVLSNPHHWPIQYCWMDTCTIDKTSSAELTEAINSMFDWYRGAYRCFVYLSDVEVTDRNDGSFSESRWWTRGWTLQELIAPLSLTFFNANWCQLGNKAGMASRISGITGIPRRVLSRPQMMYRCSVAQRMSWAAKRHTSRVEDLAYSLMGLFNVNMPLLYGEGKKSFVRLQEEILKESTDHTIFAWFSNDNTLVAGPHEPAVPSGFRMLSGVLATHPRQFLNSSHFRPTATPAIADMSRFEVLSTNVGLRLSLPVVRRYDRVLGLLSVEHSSVAQAGLTESDPTAGGMETRQCLALQLWPEPNGDGRLVRMESEEPFLVRKSDYPDIEIQTAYLCKTNWSNQSVTAHGLKANAITLKGSLATLEEKAFQISRCFFSNFPLRDWTIFEAPRGDAYWKFWRPDVGSGLLLLELANGNDEQAHRFSVMLTEEGGKIMPRNMKVLVVPGHFQAADRVGPISRLIGSMKPLDSRPSWGLEMHGSSYDVVVGEPGLYFVEGLITQWRIQVRIAKGRLSSL